MPTSPQKRVTRARAKAAEDGTAKIVATKITTPAVKATKITKRKTRNGDEEEQPESEASAQSVNKPEPVKATRGRPKKVIDPMVKSPEEDAKEEKPVKSKIEISKTRGRTKRTTAPATTIAQTDDNKEIPTTTRAVRMPTTNRSASIPKAVVIKKKVTFDDDAEQDKENLTVIAQKPKKQTAIAKISKPAEQSTGLRAKPVRKPAAPRVTRLGKKATEEEKEEGTKVDKNIPAPLSPKKAKQVATVGSVSSDDELSGEKTPVRALSRSPVKRLTSAMPTTGKRLFDQSHGDLATSTDTLKSPSKGLGSSILGSPARRPPPSPFKEALKQSPKKLDLGESTSHPALKPMFVAVEETLKISPKRGNLGNFIMQPTAAASASPFKASLLQSPARRPVGSPMRAGAPGSPGKGRLTIPVIDSANISSPVRNFNASIFTPGKTLTSTFRALKSPEQSPKVHNMTPREVEERSTTGISGSSLPLTFGEEIIPSVISRSGTPSESCSEDLQEGSERSGDVLTGMTSTPKISMSEAETAKEQTSSETSAANEIMDTAKSNRSTTPTDPLPSSLKIVSNPRLSQKTSSPADSCSDDELQSNGNNFTPTPLGDFDISTRDFGEMGMPTPTAAPYMPKSTSRRTMSERKQQRERYVSMTPLAQQLSTWLGASPDKKVVERRQQRPRGIFSPFFPSVASNQPKEASSSMKESPEKTSFFEDEMSVREQQDTFTSMDTTSEGDDLLSVPATDFSECSEVYGDENAIPVNPFLVQESKMQAPIVACTPARLVNQTPLVIHTLSKIPLKDAADVSHCRRPLKRSKSMSESTPPRRRSSLASISKEDVSQPFAQQDPTPTKSLGDRSTVGTPALTPRREVDAQTLKGAVVYVDVHTSEGADASGIFVELLTQMGARCVKQWNWNPKASLNGMNDDSRQDGESTPASKIGITHVVFKDGGKRTLEKVRESNGVVLCVGVGWVLDCERENKWLDESDYTVDTSLVPRGGHRRRKSMEPRALSNINGNLVLSAETPITARQNMEMSPTQEFLTFSSPASRRESTLCPTQPSTPSAAPEPSAPSTPIAITETNVFQTEDENATPASPTTPYFLSKGAALIQQTCPPKQQTQGQKLLFPLSGEIADQPDENVRRRLVLARRRSLMWAPRVGSPLGK
ncbi:MAG: hypothetical protein M1827_001954 [Pycnora praestabilis]|nr:MAG: hypothetical protein M1827_001954 [Pycnora praestabilis]